MFHRAMTTLRSTPRLTRRVQSLSLWWLILIGVVAVARLTAGTWHVGTPMVTYWCGPTMTDTTAEQMKEGGWNLVWCGESELDVVHRHGMRGQLTDGLLTPATLDNAEQRQKLDALIARVKPHPALYAYFLRDEPSAADFPGLGRLVAYLRERDPDHLAYINLFPTYATNQQLGNQGDVVTAYREHLRQFVDVVKPALISYDHYQFSVKGDNDQYFLNLALIRRAALDSGLPFLNIVQACTWTPSMRVPTPDEMRYLVYTTLAYGAQGISYYVYACPNHQGAIAAADGTPTPLYHALKTLNREFVAIASELQGLQSISVLHAGMHPRGTEPWNADAPFALDPPTGSMEYRPPERVRGAVLGVFGKVAPGGAPAKVSHAVVVNLDYQSAAVLRLKAEKPMEVFDAGTGTWGAAAGTSVSLPLAGGGGRLIRLAQ